jgi:SAM-dependent methyltransferase
MISAAICQACSAPLTQSWVDLGQMPLANSNVRPEVASTPDKNFPLHARVCGSCLLVQVDAVVPREDIFNEDYAYYSSYSDSWLRHCELYVAMMIKRFGLGRDSQVIEIASNDGYMLQYFVRAGIPVLGIEPSANTAKAAIEKGVETETRFFGLDTARDLAARGKTADLLAAKNVMAHVPDINDFVAGVAALLKAEGVFTVEFPHLLNTVEYVQFDQIYHEHFTYLSMLTVLNVYERHGLRIFDVEELPTHGGSLRVFGCLAGAAHAQRPNVERVLAKEREAGLDRPEGYQDFTQRVEKVRDDLVAFLRAAQQKGNTVLGYGAAAKGNTLLNYAGIGTDLIPMIADRSAAKQGRLCPGSRIPIVAPEVLLAAKPDYVLILPWNLVDEVKWQLEEIRSWGGRFVTALPELKID